MLSGQVRSHGRDRLYVVIATLLLSPIVAHAQTRATIVGTVRDTAGARVEEADISIAALRLLTRTNDSGSFTARALTMANRTRS